VGYFEICNIFVENFKAMDKIIGIGNALTDIMTVLENDSFFKTMNLPKGSTQFIDKERLPEILRLLANMDTKRVPGGSSANTIRALAHMGINTGYIGKVGHDETGDFYRNSMYSLGIDAHFRYSDFPSGIASTYISADGERSFIDYLGAAATLESSDIDADVLKGYNYLYIEGYLVQNHDMISHVMELAKSHQIKICMDMSSYNVVAADLDFFKMLINNYVDIVFANEQEASAYTQKGVEEALDELGKHCEIAIVKVGSKGSYIRKGRNTIHVDPDFVEHPIDTNGAGDYYAAGFLSGLLKGYSLEVCGRLGSLLSKNIINVVGTALSEEQWEQVTNESNKIITDI